MVAVLLAEGFEEIEALTPIDILRRAGVKVTTYALGDLRVKGAHGIVVEADCTLAELWPGDAEVLILPGGPGYVHLDASSDVERLIMDFVSEKKIIAAICAAPSILGKRGILDGEKATCFPSMEKDMGAAFLTETLVEESHYFITAKGAGAAAAFGFAILARLRGKAEAMRIRGMMQYE